MLTKIIKFKDYNGNDRTKTCYFNLTKAEILEFDMGKPGGTMAYMARLVDSEQMDKAFATFKELVLMSYGERTPDGQFIKTQEMRERFACSEAYSELMLEIMGSKEAMEAFINGLTPNVSESDRKKAKQEVQDAMARGDLPMIPEIMEQDSVG